MTGPEPRKSRMLECRKCGFALAMDVPLPAWCPLCDEDDPSQLRERREYRRKKTSEEAA